MRAVVGVSMGASAIRSAVMDPMGRALLGTEAVPSPASSSVLDAAIAVVDSVAHRHHAQRDSAVLVVPDDPDSRLGRNALEVHDGGPVRLASELGAQLMYLRMRGLLGPSRVVAIVDIGRTGISVSVLDSSNGRVHAATRSDFFRGDAFFESVYDYLLTNYGAREAMTPEALARLAEGVEWSLEMLAVHRVVRIGGPFVEGSVNLWRTTIDKLVFEQLTAATAWVVDVLDRSPRPVDSIVLVGGCANLPVVRGTFAQACGTRLITPSNPESVAAKGAALLAVQRARVVSRPEPLLVESQSRVSRHAGSY